MVGFFTFRDWSRGDGALNWTDNWGAWLFIIGLPLLMTWLVRGRKLSAGADWFMYNDTFVKTYDLLSVTGDRWWSGVHLELIDAHGTREEVKLLTLQLNPALWDLVYNGILHSVANGARVNDVAIEELQLQRIVELREPPPPWMENFRPNIDKA